MADLNPNIQRISLEEIQEFSNLDLFNLTWEQTNGRLVLLAYDPRSKTFVYNYAEPGTDGGDQNLTMFYGKAQLISDFLADPAEDIDSQYRPSINGFDHKDGIIAETTVGAGGSLVTKLDFYEVEITKDINDNILTDRYVFVESLVAGSTPGESGTSGTSGVSGSSGTSGTGSAGASGTSGVSGVSYKTSTVFTRTSTLFENKTVVVTGGSYSSPMPTQTTIDGIPTVIVWSDGIPTGSEKVWTTKFTYRSNVADVNDPANIWSTPAGITDTSTTDYEYSAVATSPGDPTNNPGNWTGDPNTNPTAIVWMAQRVISNGVYGPWDIIKVKGETGASGQDGQDGSSVSVAGRGTACDILNNASAAQYSIWLVTATATVAEMLACSGITMSQDAQVNDSFLRVPDGTGEGAGNWDNIGNLVGIDGASYKYSIVFQRSALNPPPKPVGGSFGSPVPGGWSDGIPPISVPIPAGELLWQSSRHFSDDPAANAALADWITPTVAGDTSTKEVTYAYKQPNDATPAAPNVSPGLWSDTPGETEYYWSATTNKVNNIIDTQGWKINRIRGEVGETGPAGEASFFSTAFLRTNTDISAVVVSGGTYSNPLPTSLVSGVAWSDGIPAGVGAVWYTQVRMYQTDVTNDKAWPNPIKVIDSSSVLYEYSASTAKPVGDPVQGGGDSGVNSWWDDPEQVPGGTPIWMAIGSSNNGAWPTSWDKVMIVGEQGEPGTAAYSYVPSSMFCRCENNSMGEAIPIGKYLEQINGIYNITGPNPTVTVAGFTYEFTDGIPDLGTVFPNNGKRIWMIQGVLNNVDNLGVGNEYVWGNPTVLADSAVVDFQYRAGNSATTAGPKPSNPSGIGINPDSTGWYANPDQVPGGAFWIAQKNWSEGPAAQWVVYQIRGEGEGGGSAPLTWTLSEIRDHSNEGTSNSGDEACSWGSYLSMMPVYYSGTAAVGDYFAYDAAGTMKLSSSTSLWISNDVNAWQLDINGKIVEVFTCRVGGMLAPNIPGVYANNTTAEHRIDIFPAPSSITSGGPITHLRIYASTTPGGAGNIIATVPFISSEATKFTWSPGTGYYGPYYFSTTSLTAADESPRSSENYIYYNRTIQLLPYGFTSKQALVDYLSFNPTSNVPFYVAATTIVAASSGAAGSVFYTGRTVTYGTFNGGDGWFGANIPGATTVDAYQIDSFGVTKDFSVLSLSAVPPAVNIYHLSAGYVTTGEAEGQVYFPTVVYNDTSLADGERLYTDVALTVAFNGGALWYKAQEDNANVFFIFNGGLIDEVYPI